MKVAHLTTVDLSLRFLVLPQLTEVVARGGTAVGISSPGPWADALEGMGIRHLPISSSTRGFDLRADIRSMVALFRILRRERPDILHTHNPKTGVYGRLIGRIAGVPVVVNTVHGFYATESDSLRRRLPVYLLEALASRFSDMEFFQNIEDLVLAHRLRLVPTRKAVLLGNGVDLVRFDPRRFDAADRLAIRAELGIDPADVVIGTVGRLVREKGFAELFEAVPELSENACLIVVGPEDPSKADALPPEVIAEARRLGVRFLGMRSDVDRLYAIMDVFVLPSHREGFPRAAMEASAMGLPIVATDIRGCRQVVAEGSTGFLVPVADPIALASVLNSLVEEPGLRQRMGEAANAKAQAEFDEREVVARVFDGHRLAWESKGRHWELADGLGPSGQWLVDRARPHDVDAIARLHVSGIATGFLSTLGVRFLAELYTGMLESDRCGVWVARSGGRVVGFVAGADDTSAFYREFLRSRRSLSAGVYAAFRIADPRSWRGVVETLRHGIGSDPAGGDTAGELLSIAVLPSSRGRGVARALVRELQQWFIGREVETARVVVGAENASAIALYRSAGFTDSAPVEIHSGAPSLVLSWNR